MEQSGLSLGEKRVRNEFNVADGPTSTKIDLLKKQSAELINTIDSLMFESLEVGANKGEFFRLKATAMTYIETAAMYAVKAATFKEEYL